jgi:hypothetical protein
LASFAASATPCALVAGRGGDEAALELLARQGETLFSAPRILNEPVRCRLSSLSHTSQPACSLNVYE